MRTIISSTISVLMLMAGSAAASEIVIPLKDHAPVETIDVTYQCDDDVPVEATYINAGTIALAVLDIDGEQVVATNVLSGSGARYAAGVYVWWTKGETADLYELTEGDEDTPALSCTAVR